MYILKLIYCYKFKDAKNCKISIFIDENNNPQAVSLVKMLKRMNVAIPPAQSELIDVSYENINCQNINIRHSFL